MENKIIMLQSITYATKARNFLMRRYGIHSDIVKTPKINNTSTCGYSLYVPVRFDEAVSALRSGGFKIEGVSTGDAP